MHTRTLSIGLVFRLIGTLVILFVGFKACLLRTWSPEAAPVTYAIHGVDGRSLVLTFLPDRRLLFAHKSSAPPGEELVLAKYVGTYASHYVGRIWNLSDWGNPLAFRLFPADTAPISLNVRVVAKRLAGGVSPALPDVGHNQPLSVLVAPSRLRLESMWLEQEVTDLTAVQSQIASLGPSANVP